MCKALGRFELDVRTSLGNPPFLLDKILDARCRSRETGASQYTTSMADLSCMNDRRKKTTATDFTHNMRHERNRRVSFIHLIFIVWQLHRPSCVVKLGVHIDELKKATLNQSVLTPSESSSLTLIFSCCLTRCHGKGLLLRLMLISGCVLKR